MVLNFFKDFCSVVIQKWYKLDSRIKVILKNIFQFIRCTDMDIQDTANKNISIIKQFNSMRCWESRVIVKPKKRWWFTEAYIIVINSERIHGLYDQSRCF